MGFCKKSWPKIKKVITLITPALETVIETALKFTGQILALSNKPGVKELMAELLPQTPEMQAAIIAAMKKLTNTQAILNEPNPAAALALFVQEIKALGIYNEHAKAIKWAQLIVAIMDGNKHKEKEYDTMVQASTLYVA